MEAIIILVLILFNGLLSMTEIALVSARKSKLEAEAKRGKKRAQAIIALKESPDNFLSTIQIGITLIGILTGLFSGESIARQLASFIARWEWMAPCAGWVSKTLIVLIVTYLTLVLGELLPKHIGLRYPEKMAEALHGLMKFFSAAAYPFVWLLSKSTRALIRLFGLDQAADSKVTEEEIKALIEEGAEEGEIEEVEQDIVGRVFNLSDRNVGSIMTHRNDLVWLDITDSKEDIRRQIMEHLHDIYPVAREQIDDIRGVVFMKDLFGKTDLPDFALEDYIRRPLFFPETLSVYIALEELKKQYSKYALVMDEFGGVQGIVTLADIMEAVVGEIPDTRGDEDIVVRDDGSLLIDGQCPFYHFLESFDMENQAAEYPYNTLSGLILEELEHIPSVGEKLLWNHLEIEIVDMDRARIDKVLVHRLPDSRD